MAATLICDGCGNEFEEADITRTLEFDFCPGCCQGMREQHARYADSQSHRMSRDAMCPVPEQS